MNFFKLGHAQSWDRRLYIALSLRKLGQSRILPVKAHLTGHRRQECHPGVDSMNAKMPSLHPCLQPDALRRNEIR
jgi:hypothetical protein